MYLIVDRVFIEIKHWLSCDYEEDIIPIGYIIIIKSFAADQAVRKFTVNAR